MLDDHVLEQLLLLRIQGLGTQLLAGDAFELPHDRCEAPEELGPPAPKLHLIIRQLVDLGIEVGAAENGCRFARQIRERIKEGRVWLHVALRVLADHAARIRLLGVEDGVVAQLGPARSGGLKLLALPFP